MTTSTPWGPAQSCEVKADGIVFYSTASHGGFYLNKNRLADMPDYMKGETFGSNGPNWYEEDCDWAMVAVVFPEAFPREYKQAVDILRNWQPRMFERFFGVTLTTDESYVLRQAETGDVWAVKRAGG